MFSMMMAIRIEILRAAPHIAERNYFRFAFVHASSSTTTTTFTTTTTSISTTTTTTTTTSIYDTIETTNSTKIDNTLCYMTNVLKLNRNCISMSFFSHLL